jgi:FtsH-binding integral membrane protein
MGFSYAATTGQVRSGVERATLIRRTYGLVSASIFVTMLGVGFTLAQDSMLAASAQHPFILAICGIIPLIMVQRSPRVYPKNLILTFLFTFIEGIAIAPFLLVAERNAPGSIAQAGVLTLAAFGALTLYAVMSRRDFSAWGGFFFVGLIVLVVTTLLNGLVFHSAGVMQWMSGVGVLIFSGLLVFDTWRLTRSGMYGEDDYALLAVSIYLDLLNMFLFILSLLSGGRRRD